MTNPTPEAQRVGDWMQTFTGIQFWPLDPQPEEINIEDIAHALSNLCRYNGHCDWYYSVAQHSVIVSGLVPPVWALTGLLHDAAEAYIGDMIRPLKGSLPAFKKIERQLEVVVSEKFSLLSHTGLAMKQVKIADNIALATEQRDLMGPPPKAWDLYGAKPMKEVIVPLNPKEAEINFLDRFEELGGDL